MEYIKLPPGPKEGSSKKRLRMLREGKKIHEAKKKISKLNQSITPAYRKIENLDNVFRKKPKYFTKNGYAVDSKGNFLHHNVFKRKEGPLIPKWHIHHCDGKKTNNAINNLVQLPGDLHFLIHESIKKKSELPSKDYIKNVLLVMWFDGRESFVRDVLNELKEKGKNKKG